MQQAVAIAAVSEMRPSRYPDYDDMEMYRQVMIKFLQDWNVHPHDIQGVMAAPAGMAGGGSAEIFTHEKLYDELGLHPRFSETINAGGATYSIMVQRAALAIAEGLADSILCIGAGKFPRVGAGGAEQMAKMISHAEFEYIYGPAIYAIYAQAATRHMYEYGTTREQLAQVAVSARKWALKHPDAFMRSKGEITVKDVLSSRPIAWPFNMLDCSVPCEGGGALLVTTDEIARRINAQPAYILGMGEYHTHGYISQAPSLTTQGARFSGEQAFRRANLSPADIDVVEIYDAFTINPLIYLEDLGFCPKGEGGKFVQEGHTEPGGDLPLNTYGGLLSFGHVGDASGMSMLVEGALQVMGRAGERQVRARTALVHSYGGMMAEHATLILGRQL
ncbi:MAG: thiolase family protein [Ktedonobacteraceae bacterium]|nr:thiolase family protein [Ktedonobacteraceae bacterium]